MGIDMRRKTTGRFDTRAKLCEAVWREWLYSKRNQADIARYCRVSPMTVANILNSKEGKP